MTDPTPPLTDKPSRISTMKDVAERAGVSVATVSLVINDSKNARIGAKTRQRVHDAVDALGYRPNALAQSLANNQSRFIGMVADAIATLPFAGEILRGAQDEAWKNGYVLLVANTDDIPERTKDAISMMNDHQAVGVLYSTWYHRQVEPVKDLERTPAVYVNCYSDSPRDYSIVPDEFQGGALATRMLLEHGHRRVAFINSTEDAPSTVGREKGYRSALADAGIPCDDSLVHRIFPDAVGGFQEAGYSIAGELLDRDKPPTAVFCYNDRVAMGLYEAAKERGLRIPEDIAIIGFDDQEVIAAHLRPGLTSIALPHHEIGVRAVRALLSRIDGGGGGIEYVPCPAVIRYSI
ncbi:LacI family DNA-binding transcriptional regulator [Microbacterium lacticum]|uniref:LacI family DNA-binding transcriptional regulator n=1 Tax=uncultured Microbacterium sp. TaxID=191216 RepID=UPI002631B9D5|nr:LacI family DNA-binding transcriptional regulator [uncultured Microbacterium sp.]